jgi:hypothetical protein
MKLAIMQPYFFPYVGYFNLVAAVDKFVFYDDVNFIKNGWINRNRLFISGDVRYITVPLSGASSNIKIKDVKMQDKIIWQKKLLTSIEQSYAKAPNFSATFELVNEIIDSDEISVAKLAKNSVIKIAEKLCLNTNFVWESGSYQNEHLSSSERVIDICKLEDAKEYINLPGGRELYQSEQFEQHGILLKFIDPKLTSYNQFKREFMSGLSIIDILMFNNFSDARKIVIGS